jgi:hypothetical protein
MIRVGMINLKAGIYFYIRGIGLTIHESEASIFSNEEMQYPP